MTLVSTDYSTNLNFLENFATTYSSVASTTQKNIENESTSSSSLIETSTDSYFSTKSPHTSAVSSYSPTVSSKN